ncbi:SRPBCC domain-containing protein [Calothrix sp. FACHB-1219]|uniref:SRPBCC domain-containing protein n=1 Tax=unclassified Calothrix TaxID=2619626 RepID=UPI0016847E1B|nr:MULTISPECIES: SRPBCC domain-containing protein [unclassified Calothrix]MBD2203584.1 SRPBCC domain-containing protein [Calothrix sp. FACHB-168]MBD2221195.1 SRPBCC domain-containing protein [Calothrix sp. FACHB-1219]
MAFVIDTSIIIDAPPDRVFKVLTDFGAYSQWNDLLLFHSGDPIVGSKLKLELRLPDGKGFVFEPTVITCEKNLCFAWLARTMMKGVFDGEHRFELTQLEGNRTQLRNIEYYSGMLSPLFQRSPMMRDADKGFEQMNEALKTRVESLQSTA